VAQECIEEGRDVIPRWVYAVAIPLVLVFIGVMAFTIFEPIQVLPRIRLAPGFAMTDQNGDRLTSEDLRGTIVVYSFGYTDCGEACEGTNATMRGIQERIDEVDLGGAEMRFVTVSFDPGNDTPGALSTYAAEIGADGGTWTLAAPAEDLTRAIVGSGFRTWYENRGDHFAFDPTLVLVDGWGVVRGEYRYQTLAADVDKLLHHIDLLGEELRNSHGAASVAYEAAHFFLCYP
jgi:protein SCO1/2